MTIDTPDEDIIVRGLTWPKLLAIVGAIFVAAGIVIYVLLGVVYGGLQDRLDRLEKRVQSLDDNVHRTIAASASVKDLVDKAPRVERTITDSRHDIATIKTQLQTLQKRHHRPQAAAAGDGAEPQSDTGRTCTPSDAGAGHPSRSPSCEAPPTPMTDRLTLTRAFEEVRR